MANMGFDIAAIVDALLSNGWVFDHSTDTWCHEDCSGMSFAEAVIHDIELATKWRRTP